MAKTCLLILAHRMPLVRIQSSVQVHQILPFRSFTSPRTAYYPAKKPRRRSGPIQKHEVEDILNKFGNIGDSGTRLRINDVRWYQAAFVHPSYLQSLGRPIPWDAPANANQLEFLGDAYLGAVVAGYLIKRFPDQYSGFLHIARSKIVSWKMLSQFGETLRLREFILLSNDPRKRIKDEARLLEDHFESFVGAIVRDFENEGERMGRIGDQGKGYVYARRFIVNLIDKLVDFPSLLESDENFKSRLYSLCQRQQWQVPEYHELPRPPNPKPSNSSPLFWRAVVLNREDVCKLDARIEQKCTAYHEAIVEACGADEVAGGEEFNEIRTGRKFIIVGAAFGNKKIDAEHEAAKISLGNLRKEMDSAALAEDIAASVAVGSENVEANDDSVADAVFDTEDNAAVSVRSRKLKSKTESSESDAHIAVGNKRHRAATKQVSATDSAEPPKIPTLSTHTTTKKESQKEAEMNLAGDTSRTTTRKKPRRKKRKDSEAAEDSGDSPPKDPNSPANSPLAAFLGISE
ncbi:hypothetical protein HK102_004206 [Quaeritorhiza haematococci]|nr:hypothetical protein HK102_004206 [Quaeritorhiza haematococci]